MGKRFRQLGKKLFLSAGIIVSAAMLGACSGDNLPVQSAWQSVEGQESAQGAVGFDAYLSRATSRNGAEGELTLNNTATGKVSLEGKGFGVFAYYTDNADYDGHSIPNFMWNQQVAKDATAGWTYSPVKYWPNEFGSAEAEEADRVSFFAYAPYVEADVASGKTAAATGEAEGTGITAFSRNDASGDPLVKYVVSLDPKRAVDLCWGTVDSDRSWTKANKIPDPENPGSETSETQSFVKGMPWLNVERPSSVSAADSKVKFQFEHALAQLNIQVKNDVDIASPADAGENVGSQTRVWIRSITLSGLSTKGTLNLHNTVAGKARWLDYKDSRELLAGETCTVCDGREDGQEGTLASTDEKVTGINPALVQTDGYVVIGTGIEDATLTCATPTSTGVTNEYKNMFSGDGAAAAGDPIYVIPTGEAVKVTIAYDVETYSPNLATYLSDGKTRGASVSNVITKDITLSGGAPMTMANGKKYTVKLHLGLNSVKFDAAVSDWETGDSAEPGLPGNDPGISLSRATIGMIIASNGKAYKLEDYDESYGEKVAVVAKPGFAIALQDAERQTWNEITSNGANNNKVLELPESKRGSKVPVAPEGTTWNILTRDQYISIFKAMGGKVDGEGRTTYSSTVNKYITDAGGAGFFDRYWSTSEFSGSLAWSFHQNAWNVTNGNKANTNNVRPVLVWDVPTTLSALRTWVNANPNDDTFLGYYVEADGSISTDNSGAIGIVAYYGDAAVDESAPDSHILVLATEDAASAKWKTTVSDGESAYKDVTKMNGIAFTNAYGNNAAYPAAQAAKGYSAARPTGASIWFLPSYAQWQKMIDGGKTGITSDWYWSSTAYNSNSRWAWVFNNTRSAGASKTDDRPVRTAFAY